MHTTFGVHANTTLERGGRIPLLQISPPFTTKLYLLGFNV